MEPRDEHPGTQSKVNKYHREQWLRLGLPKPLQEEEEEDEEEEKKKKKNP